MKCYHASRWGGSRRVKIPCVICGTLFEKFAAAYQTCCSAKCRHKRKTEVYAGPKSHFWRGGATAPYCDGWKEIQREVVKRDGGKCTICGSATRLSVHHKNPYRYCKNHDKRNLTTLCRRCHSKEELKVNEAMRSGLKYRWRH
jgi:5-methylcytosine-specific restriction endonuclease McrA